MLFDLPPVLPLNVYGVLPSSICEQVKQPCLEFAAKCARGCRRCPVRIFQFSTNQEVAKVRRESDSRRRQVFL